MIRLDEEKDIEVLRQAALLLEKENARLVQKVVELTKVLATARGDDVAKVQLRIQELERQLAERNRALFGKSSEKREGPPGAPKEKPKQTGHGPNPQTNLKVVEQVLDLDQPDKQCPKCGGGLAELKGQFEESEEITVVTRQFVKTVLKRKKYRWACNACIETAPLPPKLFAGARYSIDWAIEVAIDKYLDHLPLERQVRVMRRDGLVVESQTLWEYLERLARHCEGAHERLHAMVLTDAVIGADETEWPLLRMNKRGVVEEDKSRRWRAWVVANDEAVCYRITPDRSEASAKRMLRSFEGVVMCDGYSAYDACRASGMKVELAHCWSHVRRKFYDLKTTNPAESERALELIGDIFAVERLCPTGPPADDLRRRLRGELSKPAVAKFKEFLHGLNPIPESGLHKAALYALNLWPGLVLFLDNPRIPVDNNASERAMRGVVLGRKNHYGSRSRRGTEVAAVFYSLLETAKLVGVDPRAYLRAVVAASLQGAPPPLPHELRSPPSA